MHPGVRGNSLDTIFAVQVSRARPHNGGALYRFSPQRSDSSSRQRKDSVYALSIPLGTGPVGHRRNSSRRPCLRNGIELLLLVVPMISVNLVNLALLHLTPPSSCWSWVFHHKVIAILLGHAFLPDRLSQLVGTPSASFLGQAIPLGDYTTCETGSL